VTSARPGIGAARGSSPAASDAGLVDLAAQGDAEAFDALLRPRLDRLFRIAVALLRSEADARDAVQEGCVHAWSALPRLRDRDRFDAWLTQIVINDCRTLLRQRRRGRVREVRLDDLAGGGTSDPDPRGMPVAQVDGPDIGDVEAVRRAFDRLDPTERTLLVLHYVDERPLKEIGPLVDAPVGTVKWRLWRARRALERALEGERR
jgi:RNA polymerase sigma-70 factor (ECF subfamily)